MNDIIVFSRTSNKHLHHLNEILRLLKNSEVTLFLKKNHFVYFNIKTLKHHVSKLKLNIFKKKTKIIKKLQFSRTLKKLKIDFEFFDYYKKVFIKS